MSEPARPAAAPDDDWSEEDVTPIEDLSSATLERLATRLRDRTRCFAARINREAELDALWTLADMAASQLRLAPHGVAGMSRPELPRATADDLTELALLIFGAHDLNADGETAAAADLITQAASLANELEPAAPTMEGSSE
jgi:hypothetical protein